MQAHSALRLAVLATLALGFSAQAQTANEQSVEELRNTLVSVMDALVQKGLLTREQAQQIVANAQAKAVADAKLKAQQEEAEKNAVVVARIPETVKQDIVKQVGEQVRPLVTEDVLQDAKDKKWGVPGAMPEWLSRIKLSGDIRVRVQQDNFADENIANTYPNYLAINYAGTLSKAGADAFWNVTEDRVRERLRARLALEAQMTKGISAGVRLATGSLSDPVSTNQTLGQSGNRYQIAVDQAYIRYALRGDAQIPWMSLSIGRVPNPWMSSDLVWDPDLTFEGIAGTWRIITEDNSTLPRHFFLTAGAFPVQEIELSSKDKWMYGAQLGAELPWDGGGRFRLAGAYYYFDNISGRKNVVGSTLLNYTAPQYMQKGNTVFDILNDSDSDTFRFALAAEYHLVDVMTVLEFPALRHQVSISANYVKNIGYDQAEVLKQFGYASISAVPDNQRALFDERTAGWQVELALASQRVGKRGSWRTSLAYKRLERDAVVDAFTDSDFHLGGTDAQGYALRGDWWFRDRNSLSLRYISSDALTYTPQDDLRPFGVDTLMLDVNAQF